MAVPCRVISKLKSGVSSIGLNCYSRRSRRGRPSGTPCLPRNKSRRAHRRRCCSTSRASGPSSPPSSGRKGCSGTSTIDGRSLLTQGWHQHPGRADRPIANRACLKQEPAIAINAHPACLAMAAPSAAISPGSWFEEWVRRNGGHLKKTTSWRCAKAAGGVLEICDSRRHHRGSRHESRQTIDAHPILRPLPGLDQSRRIQVDEPHPSMA